MSQLPIKGEIGYFEKGSGGLDVVNLGIIRGGRLKKELTKRREQVFQFISKQTKERKINRKKRKVRKEKKQDIERNIVSWIVLFAAR